MSRCIDADALIADCQLAQKQADRHGREFANAFYSGGGEVSTEWWCVEDMIENAPTIEPERTKGKWIKEDQYIGKWDDTIEILRCPICEFKHDYTQGSTSHDNDGWFNYCPHCGADMRKDGKE